MISRLGIFRPHDRTWFARKTSRHMIDDVVVGRWVGTRLKCVKGLSCGKDIYPLRTVSRARGKSKLWTVSTIFPSESPSRNMRFILACRSRCHTLCTACDMLPENPISTRIKLKPSSGENYDDYTIALELCDKYIDDNYCFKIFI